MRGVVRTVFAAVLAAAFTGAWSLRGGDNVVHEETLLVQDRSGRSIPVASYYTDAARQPSTPKLAILSHGYRMKNTDYGFIARHLAVNGYLVMSIQHELPGDEPLPTTGNPYETRKPSWERGVQSIVHVVDELRKRRRELRDAEVLLVGHSHGGDTSMLCAEKYPELATAVISLDNRRMPFPRAGKVRILSLRSSDSPPDENVIPAPEEQTKLGIRVVNLPATKHGEMWDGATDEQKAEMLRFIDGFLQQPK